MHKILFLNEFISCLYMFRAHVFIIKRSKLHYTASGIIIPIDGHPAHRLREDWFFQLRLQIAFSCSDNSTNVKMFVL